MRERTDVVVVGAGIVGLATAHRLLEARPGLHVSIVEKEGRVGAHQSSHNSGVLHAGIYYQPGSRKAILCRQGKAQLEEFAQQHGIPVEHVGKLIVATEPSELEGLERLRERAAANAVPGVRMLDADEISQVEPAVTGVRALHSPATAITDFGAVCLALAGRVQERGGELLLGRAVTDLRPDEDGVEVRTGGVTLRAAAVVTCAGLQSDRLAAMTGAAGDERIVPFRGAYLRLRPRAAALVRGNVYPVPDPAMPFLGTHLTRRIDGEVWAGPNALLAGAREGYRRGAFDRRDLIDTLTFPGFWRLAARHGSSGIRELLHDRIRALQVRELRRFLPDLTAADLEPGPSGIRAQAVRRNGALVDDFSISGEGRVLHVRNAPSPAATASLAIGRFLAERVFERLS